MRKSVFTTGQVAKLCAVAPRTVSKWFDSGILQGYRVPGSQDRRVPRDNLVRFMREYGIPLGELEQQVYRKLLLVGTERLLVDLLRGSMSEHDGYRLETAACGFEAGVLMEQFRPHCVLVDLALGRVEAGQIAQHLGRAEVILAALGEEAAAAPGFHLTLRRPLHPAECPEELALLANRLRALLEEQQRAAYDSRTRTTPLAR